MKPLYRWAGGKTRMLSKYDAKPGIPLNGYDVFIEPFFGGGAMSIYIYENNAAVKKFVINDVNKELMDIYRVIKQDVKAFIDNLDEYDREYIPKTKDDRKKYYYELRDKYINNNLDNVEESALLYFLLKTCFNGVWQSKQDANGKFATPFGLGNEKKSVYDGKNIREWHDFLQRAEIYSVDWKTCVDAVYGTKAFYFFDPPYRDCFTSYAQSFTDDNQTAVVEFCKKAALSGHYVMFANKDSGDRFFDDRRGSLNLYPYAVTHTAGRRKKEKNNTYSAKKAIEILLTDQ